MRTQNSGNNYNNKINNKSCARHVLGYFTMKKKLYLLSALFIMGLFTLCGCNKIENEPNEEPEEPKNELNGHEWVDLGLPSGTLWATCNVGASSPEEYGNYYAWGETLTKGQYDESTYTYTDNPNKLPLSADAAAINWGEGWMIPSENQWSELINNCSWERNGWGTTFTGRNGNSLYLPSAGFDSDDIYAINGVHWDGCGCFYWSSTICADDTSKARFFYSMDSDSGLSAFPIFLGVREWSRRHGFTIRPVCYVQ